MSDIRENLQKILSAVWGRDVRQAIHDSIRDCYEDGSAGSLDIIAREGVEELETTKATRVELAEETADRLAEVAVERNRIDNLISSGSDTGSGGDATKRTETVLFESSTPSRGVVFDESYIRSLEIQGNINNYDYIDILYGAFDKYNVITIKTSDIPAYVVGSSFIDNCLSWSEESIPTVSSSSNYRADFKMSKYSGSVLYFKFARWTIHADGNNYYTSEDGSLTTSSIGILRITGVKYEEVHDVKDAELSDVRVGADGTVYQTAGGAVRGQVGDITNRLNGIESNFGDEYDNTATYSVGDKCIHVGAWYRCNTAIETAEEWTAGHWDRITLDTISDQVATNTSDIQDLKEDLNNLPNLFDTDEDDADLFISDAEGNVIVEFSDGHIKTQNFDSANITPSTGSGDVGLKRSNSSADLVISDNAGNALVELSDGHIKTKNFNSENVSVAERISGTDYSKTFSYDASASTTQTIEGDFKQGNTILCHVSNTADDVTDFLYARLATYGYIDRNNSQHTLGQEYAYNFARFVLPEDAIGIYGIFPAELLGTGTYTFKFLVYKLSDYERKPNIITVGADGRRQFTSVRQAMDSFHDNNAYNRYEIWVYPGTYNIMDDFTDAEIRIEGFKGLFVKNGVKIKGIGHREQIILHGELSTTDYSSTIRNQISTLNMSGCCGLENLTITNRYMRYAVHDDHGSGFYQEQTRIVENCKFRSTDAVSGGIGQAAYGAGGHNNKKLIIRNCDLGDRLIIHNTQLMVVPMFALVENCTAQQVTLTDNNNTGFTAKTRVEFNNCNFDYVLHDKTSDGTEPTMILCGTGSNNIKLDCEANTLYNFGDCMTFPVAINAGQAVKMSGIRTVEATTSKADMYGISIGNDGSHTYVQRKGYIAAQVLGLTGLLVGDYITLNSSGVCVAGGTVNDAVGVVECIAANTSTAFIKLLF